jgi:hypothetical protein
MLYLYNLLFPMATSHSRVPSCKLTIRFPLRWWGVDVFGRDHARVYRELEQQGEAVRLAGVVDRNLERADELVSRGGQSPHLKQRSRFLAMRLLGMTIL